MIDQETLDMAKEWVDTGVQWIDNGAHSMGVKYLDRAIPVFLNTHDVAWLTYTRHQRMRGLHGMGQEEEVELMFEEVMQGYVELDDTYGKVLALLAAAEAAAHLKRWERATTQYNMAIAVARMGSDKALRAFATTRLAAHYLERENLATAVRLYHAGETLYDQAGLSEDALQNRLHLAQALVRLGERNDAIVRLEDAQAQLFRLKHYRQALEPLKMLMELYDESQMANDKSRISQLIHFCGQYILQNRDARAKREETKLEVRRPGGAAPQGMPMGRFRKGPEGSEIPFHMYKDEEGAKDTYLSADNRDVKRQNP